MKICPICRRPFSWRRKWAKCWDEVRYCSAACRRRKVRSVDIALERSILVLLGSRGSPATICPDEAAKAVDPVGWRELREPARRAARRLVAAGEVVVTQRGRLVDPSTSRGPIRVRLRQRA